MYRYKKVDEFCCKDYYFCNSRNFFNCYIDTNFHGICGEEIFDTFLFYRSTLKSALKQFIPIFNSPFRIFFPDINQKQITLAIRLFRKYLQITKGRNKSPKKSLVPSTIYHPSSYMNPTDGTNLSKVRNGKCSPVARKI